MGGGIILIKIKKSLHKHSYLIVMLSWIALLGFAFKCLGMAWGLAIFLITGSGIMIFRVWKSPALIDLLRDAANMLAAMSVMKRGNKPRRKTRLNFIWVKMNRGVEWFEVKALESQENKNGIKEKIKEL